jgi:23S rRNA (adenine2503-C2)-methyltransferase
MPGARAILRFSRPELEQELVNELALEPYRARQLFPWLYKRRVRDFSGMTDVARDARELLAGSYEITRPVLDTVAVSKDGTRKFLFALDDGSKVETVLIHQPARWTLCVSSQVGCPIGCKFCRTGLMGLKRSLGAHEIVGQVLAVQDHLAAELAAGREMPSEFSNIVFMGMGEPFNNFDEVVRSVLILNDELGPNFSQRKITVSTSGLVPQIKQFGELDVPANLAVSLNATTDEVRSKLIPINRRWPLEVLLQTLREFPVKRRERITIEYVMLKDVNDTDDDMHRLPKLLHGIPTKLNLIPYNSNSGLGLEPSSVERVQEFQRFLLGRSINATIRYSKGDDISAACGQLATSRTNG